MPRMPGAEADDMWLSACDAEINQCAMLALGRKGVSVLGEHRPQ